jgi:hypothetical protein
MRSQIQAIDPDQSVSEVKTMEAILDASLGKRRTTMLLLDLFAGVALLLAVIGIYGTITYSVAQAHSGIWEFGELSAHNPFRFFVPS